MASWFREARPATVGAAGISFLPHSLQEPFPAAAANSSTVRCPLTGEQGETRLAGHPDAPRHHLPCDRTARYSREAATPRETPSIRSSPAMRPIDRAR